MIYEVHTGARVHEAIRQAVRYIAVYCQSPMNAERWLDRLWDRIDELEEMPRRFPIDSAFSQRTGQPTHRMTFGSYLVFYQVDDARRRVDVVFFRHGAMRSGDDEG